MDGLASLWMVWLVCGWFVGGLVGLWLVCGRCGWFVGDLTGLWVVSSFTANVLTLVTETFILNVTGLLI